MTISGNPFHVLGLPVTASDEEVARRYNTLCRARPAEQPAFRRAWEELRANPAVRRAHELLEMPDTDYQGREEVWRSFERANRRNPVDHAALAGATSIEAPDIDTAPLITATLDSMLSPPSADLAALAAYLIALPGGTPPIGIADLIFG